MGGPAPPLSLLTRRPLLSAAILLVGGILLHPALPDQPLLWTSLAIGLLAAALLTSRIASASTPTLAGAIVLLGVAAGQLDRYHYAPDHIAAFTADTPQLAEVELRLDQPPRTLAALPNPFGRRGADRTVAAGKVTRVRTTGGWAPASGRILLHVGQPDPRLAYDQTIAATGRLARPARPSNPGEFDWAGYYRDQRVLASLGVERPESITVVAEPGWSPLNAVRQSARRLLAKGFAEDRSVEHALLRALLLGDSDPQLRDVQDDFQRTGTSHHLSISGLHVAVLGGFVYFCCRLSRMPPRWAAVAMMAFVLLYGLVALPAPPVLRSIILCEAFGVALLLRRSVDGVQLLAFTLVVMLLIHPLDLYNAGFQLTFGTVLGLMIMATPLAGALDKESEDDRVLRSFGILPSRAGRFRRWLKSKSAEIFAAGLVAWLVSAPLIVEHFDQLNPWAIPASILLAPIVFVGLIAGLLKVLLTLALPWLAPTWAALAALPMAAMKRGVEWLATWPASDLALPAVPKIVVIVFYALIALPLIPTARPALRWAFRSGAAAAALLALCLPLLLGFAPKRGPDLRLTVLSVGAGQCALIECPQGPTVLIDAGSSTFADVHRRILRPFLRRQGQTKVDLAIVSHANLDHFSALPQLADSPGLGKLLVTPYFKGHSAKNFPARNTLKHLADRGVPVDTLAVGQTLQLDEQTTLEVLWPPPPDQAGAARLDANNSCHVLKLTCRGKSILFTGDIQAPTETALATSAALSADVLIAPHHGSAELTTPAFVNAVNPSIILASNDNTLSGKQRAFDALIADRQANPKATAVPPAFYRTSASGAITVKINRFGAIEVETFR